MWYNDIPLNETQYDNAFHLFRFTIQLILIFTIAWIGEITPFKGEERNIKKMDVFSGRIASCGFESGDRIVIGDWKDSPFGSFSDVMWATSEGKRILIAPNSQIADYVQSLYTFEEVLIEEINIDHRLQAMTLSSESLTVEYKWNKGWSIPFSRSLFFIATVESLFARVFWGIRTHGSSKNNRKQWYAVDRVSKITEAKATINGKDAGKKALMIEQCKFGFSESPKNPSSVIVRTYIQKKSD